MTYNVEIRADIFGQDGIPHTFLIITGSDGIPHGYGFAPVVSGLTDEGMVHNDTEHEYNSSSGIIEITQQQYDHLNNYVHQEPPPYNLPFGAQCTVWALQGLADAGLASQMLVPNAMPNPVFLVDILENLVYNPYTQAVSFELLNLANAIFDEISRTLGIDGILDAISSLTNGTEWSAHISELVDDFFNAAAKFIQRKDPLTLDLDGDGIKTGTGWVAPDDGFLVLDRNSNGVIDNGRELFGNATLKSNGQLATDGFNALADLDSNNNGKIDVGDAQFGNIKVWRDLNQDGITQTGELFTLAQLGIASIKTANDYLWKVTA